MSKRSVKLGLWVAFVAITLNVFEVGQDVAVNDWDRMTLHLEAAIWAGCVMLCLVAMQRMWRMIDNLYDVLKDRLEYILKEQKLINEAMKRSNEIDKRIDELWQKQKEYEQK